MLRENEEHIWELPGNRSVLDLAYINSNPVQKSGDLTKPVITEK